MCLRGGEHLNNDASTSKKNSFGLNIGFSSILLIFVILCLVSFAALSIASADADHRLCTRVMERTASYYDACNKAEEALAGVDETLAEIYRNVGDKEEYFARVGHSKSYSIQVSDLQTLQVNIEILYPESDDDTFYRITSWQVLTIGELEDEPEEEE